jgi:hypothetical protein
MSRWAEQLINHMLIVLVVLLELYADEPRPSKLHSRVNFHGS